MSGSLLNLAIKAFVVGSPDLSVSGLFSEVRELFASVVFNSRLGSIEEECRDSRHLKSRCFLIFVLCARSKDLFVGVSARDTCHFLLKLQLVTSQDDGIEPATFDARAHYLNF